MTSLGQISERETADVALTMIVLGWVDEAAAKYHPPI
jgi:hypothetical protein